MSNAETSKEGDDIYDIIEWTASQPWSTGAIGMLGVSYLAIAQYQVSTLRPPSLKAICPWDGFTDAYRDLMMPGGVRENGLIKLWSAGLKGVRLTDDVAAQQTRRPLRDDFWQSLVPDLPKIEVPMMVCASFSDNNLHNRGTWRAFMHAGSTEKFAYTHRDGRWATFYTEPARTAQLNFFERYLRGRGDVPPPPRVRLEVRESQKQVVEVRAEDTYPIARTQWTPLYLTGDGSLSRTQASQPGQETFQINRQVSSFTWQIPEDVELTGPMAAHLWVASPDADDLDLIVGVEKWRNGRYVPFALRHPVPPRRNAPLYRRRALAGIGRPLPRTVPGPLRDQKIGTVPRPLGSGSPVPSASPRHPPQLSATRLARHAVAER